MKRPTPIMLDALRRMVESDRNRWPGGYWTTESTVTEIEPFPKWSVGAATVYGLTDRGLVEPVTRRDLYSERRITDAGRALVKSRGRQVTVASIRTKKEVTCQRK